MNKVLLIIDPQKDFMTSPSFSGALSVPGAYEDMLVLASYIEKEVPQEIVVTLDTHNKMDIAHKLWWQDKNGNNPDSFTSITVSDVENKKWMPVDPTLNDYALFYVKELEKNGKYTLLIWPDHCIDGTPGHEINDELLHTLKLWEKNYNKKITYLIKGTNPKTEHYSGLKAEVVLEDDEGTKLNTKMISYLNKFDKIEIAGEALSHCVGNTVMDLLNNLNPKDRSKITMLKDCMSPVAGFENEGQKFLDEVKNLGGKIEITKKTKLSL